MKKLILILVVMGFTNNHIKAQQEKQLSLSDNTAGLKLMPFPEADLPGKNIIGGPEKDYGYFNRTSRTLRITGLSLLGAGLILGGVGILVATNTSTNDYNSELKAERTNRALFISSAAAGIVSIPFMIMAGAYKRKARVMIETQKTAFGVPANVSSAITGISLKIPIGK